MYASIRDSSTNTATTQDWLANSDLVLYAYQEMPEVQRGIETFSKGGFRSNDDTFLSDEETRQQYSPFLDPPFRRSM